jgi:glycosyltransferase involved in cell wall biosynthesis
MEAMAIGLPVVASDVDGIAQLVENDQTGFLVPPGDVSGFSNALKKILTNSMLAKSFAQNGRQKIGKSYTAVRMVEQTSLVYKKMSAA